MELSAYIKVQITKQIIYLRKSTVQHRMNLTGSRTRKHHLQFSFTCPILLTLPTSLQIMCVLQQIYSCFLLLIVLRDLIQQGYGLIYPNPMINGPHLGVKHDAKLMCCASRMKWLVTDKHIEPQKTVMYQFKKKPYFSAHNDMRVSPLSFISFKNLVFTVDYIQKQFSDFSDYFQA